MTNKKHPQAGEKFKSKGKIVPVLEECKIAFPKVMKKDSKNFGKPTENVATLQERFDAYCEGREFAGPVTGTNPFADKKEGKKSSKKSSKKSTKITAPELIGRTVRLGCIPSEAELDRRLCPLKKEGRVTIKKLAFKKGRNLWRAWVTSADKTRRWSGWVYVQYLEHDNNFNDTVEVNEGDATKMYS